MSSSFARTALVVILSLIGASVLNTAFSSPILFPVMLFSVAVSLSLSRGFVRALPAVVMIGLTADVATLGRIGLSAAFSVGLAYAAGFFSRRFAVEHGLMLHVFAGFLVGMGALAFLFVASWLDGPSSLPVVPWGNMPEAFVSGVVSFYIVSVLLHRFEEWLSYLDSPNAF